MKAKKCHAFFVCVTGLVSPARFFQIIIIKTDGAGWDITRQKENEKSYSDFYAVIA